MFFMFCKFRKTTSTIVLMETLISDRILYNIWVVSIYINRMCIQSNPKLVSSFRSLQITQICLIFWFMPVKITSQSNFAYNIKYFMSKIISSTC